MANFLPTPGKIPSANSSTLADLFGKWQARRSIAVQQGFNPAPIDALYKQDWAKAAAGGAPMTAEEAQVAVDGAYQGTSPINKGRPTGFLGTLKNIIPDAASTLWNFPAGVANLVQHLPSDVTHLAEMPSGGWRPAGWETAHGSTLNKLGEFVRDLNRSPLGSLIPGVSAAAQATTGAGRKSLQQHPIGSLLDVLPVAGGAAKLGVLGSTAADALEAGSVASQADTLAKGGNIDLATQLAQTHGFSSYTDLAENTPRTAKVAEALGSGRPLKALIRAVPQLDEARLSLLDKFNATPLASGYRRAKSMAENATTQKLNRYVESDLKPMVKGLKEEDINRISTLATHATDWPTASEADQSVLDRLRANQDARQASDISQAKLLPFQVEGRTVVYAGTQMDLLSKLHDRLDRAISVSDKATQALEEARASHPEDSPEVTRALDRQNRAAHVLDRRDRLMAKTLSRTVPARYVPLVEDQIRQKVMGQLSGQLGADTREFSDAMSAYDRGKPLGAYLPPKTLAKYVNEARGNWQALVKEYNPIWIPSMSADDLERALHPIRFRDKPPSPSVWKSRYVNQSAGSSNFALALGLAESERLRFADNQALTESFIRPVAKTTTQIDTELDGQYERMRKSTGMTTPDAQVQNTVRSRAYTRLDSNLGLGDTPQMKKLYQEDLWIPKDLADAVAKSMQTPHPNELQKLNLASIRLFKTTVMGLSPTHQAHIWLGSMLPLMLSGGKEEFNPGQLIDSWHIAKAMTYGDVTKLDSLPESTRATIGLLNRSLDTTSAEDLMDYAHGLTMGGLVHESSEAAGQVLEFSRKLSELGANMYRSVAYLSEDARGLREGLAPEMASARGVAYANRLFVDIGGMTPIEQYVAKNLLPFYSYTRWSLSYVMQYPIDHPIRASILANLGEQEAQYNQSKGIPNTMAMLFNLGKPNSQGDQWGVQLRAFNPFRNTASSFTLAGILGGLNPALRFAMTAAGVNTLSGAPDPFPGLTIDPNTGSLVGTVKGASPLAAAEQIVPQLSLLDHYLGLSQQARSLRAADPNAFRRQVFSILNMPFVPQTYTPYLSKATHAKDQLLVANQAVSAALKNQDLSSLGIYDNIPVPAKIRPYLNGQTIVPTSEFEQAVQKIWAWEMQTGQKII